MGGSSSKTIGADESTWPENTAFWLKIIREDLDPYRLQLTNAEMMDVVRPGPGVRVLDAGCGEGYLSRMFARDGATVSGIDLNAGFVDAARDAAEVEGLAIDYAAGSVEGLPYPDGAFDVVTTNHLLNELPDIDGPIREFARVIAPGGRFVTLMLHPCFYEANTERNGQVVPLPPAEYFSVREIAQEFRVAGITSPAKVNMWLRPLEAYVNAMASAGFLISELREPHPSTEILTTPWWQENFRRPLFLMLVGTRIA